MELSNANLPEAKRADLTGSRFGRLVVQCSLGSKNGQRWWRCQCDCGQFRDYSTGSLNSPDHGKSCGCLQRERASEANKTHGCAGGREQSPEYRTWAAMLTRCTNPSASNYSYYGGRGIKVCERWATSFEAFIADMGEKPSAEHSLDRIDSNADYAPGNCRWATAQEQRRNTRRTKAIAYNGETLPMSEWASRFGLSPQQLHRRLARGWSIDRALQAPVRKQGKSQRGPTPERTAWNGMRGRCHSPKHPDYPRYGGRGIEVCQRWRNSFEAFYDDMGARPSNKHSIDRIDNDGNYEPSNVRWATIEEQAGNRATSRKIQFNNETHCASEWARITGIPASVICRRLTEGWTVEECLTVPLRGRRTPT